MIVTNTTPLILFGKRSALEILIKQFEKILVPKTVLSEVLLKHNSPEALALKKAIEVGKIQIKEIKINPLIKPLNLGDGEKEAISLAAENKCMLLTDDDKAREYAGILKIETHGSLYVLLKAVKMKLITKSKSKQILDDMIIDGFYISTDVYVRFMQLLEK